MRHTRRLLSGLLIAPSSRYQMGLSRVISPTANASSRYQAKRKLRKKIQARGTESAHSIPRNGTGESRPRALGSADFPRQQRHQRLQPSMVWPLPFRRGVCQLQFMNVESFLSCEAVLHCMYCTASALLLSAPYLEENPMNAISSSPYHWGAVSRSSVAATDLY